MKSKTNDLEAKPGKVMYIDCVGGLAGDMLLSALVDAYGDASPLVGLGSKLGFTDLSFEWEERRPHGFRALGVKISFDAGSHPRARKLSDIRTIINAADIDPITKDMSMRVFENLVHAEARAHGVPVEEAHLHEAGAVDAMADVIGTCTMLSALGIRRVACSPLPMGMGTIECSHGTIPVPAPATAFLLEGIPVVPAGVEAETVTPTGAALATTLCSDGFGPLPAMTVEKVGVGAGSRDDPKLPNITRVFVGKAGDEDTAFRSVGNTVIECNVDDVDPRVLPRTMEKLLAAGALDCHIIPVIMKKGRPGYLVSALVQTGSEKAVLDVLFTETTTLGCRSCKVEKYSLERRMSRVKTRWGHVSIKESIFGNKVMRKAAEYEDCLAISKATGIPLLQIIQEAESLARCSDYESPAPSGEPDE